MSNPTYQPGEHVRVTIDTYVDSISTSGTDITFRHDDRFIALDTTHPGVGITRVAPADGRPQPGEIWADKHGTEWYAAFCAGRGRESMVYLYAPDGRAYYWPDVHTDDQLGPIRRVRPATPVPAVPQHETAVEG